MTVLMMAVVHFIATKRNMPREEPIPLKEWPAILFRGALPLSMPIVLLGGIYSGAFTPTEAAAVAALHALDLGCICFQGFELARLLGCGLGVHPFECRHHHYFGGLVHAELCFHLGRCPASHGRVGRHLHLSKLQFLFMVNALFLVLGCFLDVSVLLLVFVPMLLPAAKLLGIDLVHFGVLVVLNMMIGLIHPPFGMLLFVTKALTGIPIGDMMREGRLFLVMLLGLLIAMTVFPEIVLWLPQTMGYGAKGAG
jgi:tripartite ATP-independent transporter DctM subunit